MRPEHSNDTVAFIGNTIPKPVPDPIAKLFEQLQFERERKLREQLELNVSKFVDEQRELILEFVRYKWLFNFTGNGR